MRKVNEGYRKRAETIKEHLVNLNKVLKMEDAKFEQSNHLIFDCVGNILSAKLTC
mgnify:FL=1